MILIAILLFICCLGLQSQIQDMKKDINVLVTEINKLKIKTGVD